MKGSRERPAAVGKAVGRQLLAVGGPLAAQRSGRLGTPKRGEGGLTPARRLLSLWGGGGSGFPLIFWEKRRYPRMGGGGASALVGGRVCCWFW